MSFLKSSCSFTRFRIMDAVTSEILSAVPDNLKRFAFSEIEDLPEMSGHGWTPFDDILDLQWQNSTPHCGEYLLFSLRLDTRRVPAGVIKKRVNLALREEMQKLKEQGQGFISRERKKEIRERVLSELQRRFLPIPAEFNVIWNTTSQEVWFASTQTRMIELLAEFFLATFNLHLEPLTPYNLASFMLEENKLPSLEGLEETQFISNPNPEL